MSFYKQDPDNTSKQIPDVSPGGIHRFSHATVPIKEVVTKRPSYVIVNKVGTYAFAYETSASVGGVSDDEHSKFVTGSVVQNAAGGPTKLDINPVMWRRTDAASVLGDVTFVYRRLR